MKILFHDYSSELSTEPRYLSRALWQSGIEASLWSNQGVSAYDVFDTVKPDVFVCHCQTMTSDILKYLSSNNSIELVLNVTGMSESQLKYVSDTLENNKVKVPLVISNDFSYKGKLKTTLNLHRLLPATDIFLSRGKPSESSLICQEAVLSNKYCDNLEKFLVNEETRLEALQAFKQYHLVQITSGEKSEHFDVRANVSSIHELFHLYRNICIAGDSDFCLSQVFFDSVVNAESMSVIAHDVDNFHDGLKELFSESEIDTEDRAVIKAEMKRQIKQRHTPFHRAATLMKLLKNKEDMMKVERIKEQLPNAIKDL